MDINAQVLSTKDMLGRSFEILLLVPLVLIFWFAYGQIRKQSVVKRALISVVVIVFLAVIFFIFGFISLLGMYSQVKTF